MRKTRFSEEQMVKTLRETARVRVCGGQVHGICEQAIYIWRERFRGMNADDMQKLHQL